jgi:hypothetical protein
MPTWGWYVVGAGLFIIAFLYISSQGNSSNQTAIAEVPSRNDLWNYNSATNLISDILNQQQTLQQLGEKPPTGGSSTYYRSPAGIPTIQK